MTNNISSGSGKHAGHSDFYAQLSGEDKQRFDEPGLLARLRGKEDRAKKLMGSFLGNFSSYVADLAEAIAAGDFADIKLHSHSIKGSAANLGADRVSSIAAEIEHGAKDQIDTVQLEALCANLQEEFSCFAALARRRFDI